MKSKPTISIFDLSEDDDGVIRLPFVPIDYGEDNDVERLCVECEGSSPQREMKELSVTASYKDTYNAYNDGKSWYEYAIFICKECYPKSGYSDASKWIA